MRLRNFAIASVMLMLTTGANAADDEAANCGHAEGTAFSDLAATIAGENKLATVEVLSAFVPWSKESGGLPSPPKGLGVRIATALPAQTGTIAEYVEAELLFRDGAVASGYFSLAGSANWFIGGCELEQRQGQNQASGSFARPFRPDRVYLSVHPLPALARPYITHGLGLKAIRTGLADDPATGEDSSDLTGAGVFYFGAGLDGPVMDLAKSVTLTPAGKLDVQVAGVVTRFNEAALSRIYGLTKPDPTIYSVTASIAIDLPGHVNVSLSYAAPLGNASEYMGDLAVFSVAYSIAGSRQEGEAKAKLEGAEAAKSKT